MTTDNILAPLASLALPDSGKLTARAEAALKFINEFRIKTAEDYDFAAEEQRAIKAKANTHEQSRTAITGPLNQALKAINALFGGPAALFDQGEIILKRKMLAYSTEQRRIADEARAQAEAAAAAERKRLADEAAAHQAAAQEQAAAAVAAAAAGDAQAAELAQAAAERAQAEAAAAATTAQMVVAAPALVPAPPKAKGIATSLKVDFEVMNLHELVKHVAANPQLINLLRADDVKLRAYVRGLGVSAELPGVRVFTTETMSARAA
jgi:colicin import membrane protein